LNIVQVCSVMLLQTGREDLLQIGISLNLPILTHHKVYQRRLLGPGKQ